MEQFLSLIIDEWLKKVGKVGSEEESEERRK